MVIYKEIVNTVKIHYMNKIKKENVYVPMIKFQIDLSKQIIPGVFLEQASVLKDSQIR